MKQISESEFARLAEGVGDDADTIFRHNPIGTRPETLLWMLVGVLTMYLDLSDAEMPCFPNTPTAETYAEAVRYVVRRYAVRPFDPEPYIGKMIKQ